MVWPEAGEDVPGRLIVWANVSRRLGFEGNFPWRPRVEAEIP